jgi:ATP-dependent Clp protease ATP-binding subunit ClpA
VIEVFTDQAYNLILLAEDEARMLGRAVVEPKHVLLALARHGNVESLFARRGVMATDIYCVVSERDGIGSELVSGSLPRSATTEEALRRAVDAAAERGVLGPSSEYLLLGLSSQPEVSAILLQLGIDDVEQMVDAHYPTHRGPLSSEQVYNYALRAASNRTPPRPGPMAPVFERFTHRARAVFLAADRSAEDVYIEPFHLLLGLLEVTDGVAAAALAKLQITQELARSRTGRENPRLSTFRSTPPHSVPPPAKDQIFGFPSKSTRRVFSENALRRAHSYSHQAIGTGHVLLGLIDIGDPNVSDALGGREAAQAIATLAASLLPGDETDSG